MKSFWEAREHAATLAELQEVNKEEDLVRRVDEALDTAVFENGYVELMQRSAHDVAIDLNEFCSDLEDVHPSALERHVEAYQRWYRKGGRRSP